MITFVTCWYELDCKFDRATYLCWINNFLYNITNCYLIIFSDLKSSKIIIPFLNNKNIRLVLKPINDFFNYKYLEYWKENHKKNNLLNTKICWEVNMLWCEKISFVHSAIELNLFDTELYGWCDIGYFRGNHNEISVTKISDWPNKDKIEQLDITRIHYGNVRDVNYTNLLKTHILNKNELGLPINPIPPEQYSISGGFFMIHIDNIKWWRDTFDHKLKLYFDNNYLVKDDQIILVDCIYSNIDRFKIYSNHDKKLNNWFMFQGLLL